MLKLFATTAMAAVLALGGQALAQTSPSTTPTQRPAAGTPGTTNNAPAARQERADKKDVDRGDRKFIENAAKGGTMEVQLGQLAMQKAQNPQVKQLAEKIVKDHQEANQKLQTIAQSMGVELPKKDMDDINKDMEKWQKVEARDFDKRYVDEMVKDHKKDTKEFDEAAKNAKDPQLKSFAAEVAPKLHEHLRMAEAAQKSMQPQTSRGPNDRGDRGTAGTSMAPATGGPAAPNGASRPGAATTGSSAQPQATTEPGSTSKPAR